MALPDPKQKPRTPPKPAPPSKDPKGTAVGRGFETQLGTAKVETGAKGQGSASPRRQRRRRRRQARRRRFCCPEYIADMRDRIIKNWNQNQRRRRRDMKYMIQRTGKSPISSRHIERKSGLDLAAQARAHQHAHARAAARRISGQRLPVELEFEYIR
jgi:hypothetical protein